MTVREAKEIVGGLSEPSKMPCFGYSLPAKNCSVGSRLRKVAGSVCEKCYALKGRYSFEAVQSALAKRLASITDPRWVAAMAFLIGHYAEKFPFFRWHDSGDLQSVGHLLRITQVCFLTPNVSHWLPTREYGIVVDFLSNGGSIPTNLNIRLSAHMIDFEGPRALAKRLGCTTSEVSKDHTKVTCPASKQGGICGDCRACWNRNVETVVYNAH